MHENFTNEYSSPTRQEHRPGGDGVAAPFTGGGTARGAYTAYEPPSPSMGFAYDMLARRMGSLSTEVVSRASASPFDSSGSDLFAEAYRLAMANSNGAVTGEHPRHARRRARVDFDDVPYDPGDTPPGGRGACMSSAASSIAQCPLAPRQSTSPRMSVPSPSYDETLVARVHELERKLAAAEMRATSAPHGATAPPPAAATEQPPVGAAMPPRASPASGAPAPLYERTGIWAGLDLASTVPGWPDALGHAASLGTGPAPASREPAAAQGSPGQAAPQRAAPGSGGDGSRCSCRPFANK